MMGTTTMAARRTSTQRGTQGIKGLTMDLRGAVMVNSIIREI
jgi:hypothetical protein